MSAAVRAVVFDRDGVLVRTELEALLRDLMPLLPLDAADLAQRWRRFLGDRALASAGAEREAARAFLDQLATELDLPRDARTALSEFDHGAYVAAYADALPALEAARARGLRVGVLTNNSAGLSARGPLVAAGLQHHIDVALSAQEIGAAKPDPRAYEAVCRAMEVPAAACVFFDNIAEHVRGARAAGLRAYRIDRSREGDDLGAGILAGLAGVGPALALEASR